MRIGDVEYTKVVKVAIAAADTPQYTDVAFALGIKVRPVLVRTQAGFPAGVGATGNGFILLENGQQSEPGTKIELTEDERLHWLYGEVRGTPTEDRFTGLNELNWFKVLLPQIRLHFAGESTADRPFVTLHYRFCELSDDEILEIAAQRAQE